MEAAAPNAPRDKRSSFGQLFVFSFFENVPLPDVCLSSGVFRFGIIFPSQDPLRILPVWYL